RYEPLALTLVDVHSGAGLVRSPAAHQLNLHDPFLPVRGSRLPAHGPLLAATCARLPARGSPSRGRLPEALSSTSPGRIPDAPRGSRKLQARPRGRASESPPGAPEALGSTSLRLSRITPRGTRQARVWFRLPEALGCPSSSGPPGSRTALARGLVAVAGHTVDGRQVHV